jgi:hypothetical protein
MVCRRSGRRAGGPGLCCRVRQAVAELLAMPSPCGAGQRDSIAANSSSRVRLGRALAIMVVKGNDAERPSVSLDVRLRVDPSRLCTSLSPPDRISPSGHARLSRLATRGGMPNPRTGCPARFVPRAWASTRRHAMLRSLNSRFAGLASHALARRELRRAQRPNTHFSTKDTLTCLHKSDRSSIEAHDRPLTFWRAVLS